MSLECKTLDSPNEVREFAAPCVMVDFGGLQGYAVKGD